MDEKHRNIDQGLQQHVGGDWGRVWGASYYHAELCWYLFFFLHPTPWTLNPTPYALRPTPYTLHPTPYALHPKPGVEIVKGPNALEHNIETETLNPKLNPKLNPEPKPKPGVEIVKGPNALEHNIETVDCRHRHHMHMSHHPMHMSHHPMHMSHHPMHMSHSIETVDCRHRFSKVLFLVPLYSKCASALTFQNVSCSGCLISSVQV